MERRLLLQALALTPLAAVLGACRSLRPRCPNDTIWDTPVSPLTIDVHAHVFNATDLQVKAFVSRVAARQLSGGLRILADFFGEVIQALSWSTVPRAPAELRLLGKIAAGEDPCAEFSAELDALREDHYERAVRELKQAAETVRARRRQTQPAPGPEGEAKTDQGLSKIFALPDTEAERKRQELSIQAAADVSPEAKSLDSVLSFLVEMFQYRYGSTVQMLKTYRSENRAIDLVIAHLVDYDWWLNPGTATPTSLPDQAEVMAAISVVTGGRVHAFVPFCPLRELQHRSSPGSTFSSLDFVKSAVMTHGAMGVKLYPPMGFAPLGNADHPDTWKEADWLPPFAHKPGFGTALDGVLRELYGWCVAHEVPVMAHTNESNGPSEKFEKLGGPEAWGAVLKDFPALQVNFGHFGAVVPGDSGNANAAGFVARMSRPADAAGARAFADAGYFSEAIDEPQRLEDALVSLFETDAGAARVLASRFMFGSDWKMLLLEKRSGRFLGLMEEIVARVATRLAAHGDYSNLTRDFLGYNAANYLGLARGRGTRNRMDAFYRENKVTTEIPWQKKVDT